MQVKVVRIYLSEDSPLIEDIFSHIQKEGLLGATVYRGVKGFSKSGATRDARFLDFRLDLPLIIEFFDQPQKIENLLKEFESKIPSGHILQWIAEAN